MIISFSGGNISARRTVPSHLRGKTSDGWMVSSKNFGLR